MTPHEKAVLALAAAILLLVPAVAPAQDDLNAMFTQGTPLFAFRAQSGTPPLILFQSSGEQQTPRVLIASRGGWRLEELPEELYNTAWVHAGRTHDRQEIWGVTEGIAGGQPYFYFVSGGTGGRAWRLRGYLRKISRFAVVDSLAMDKSGKGTLILRLEQDDSPDAPRLGHYVYLTRNGGREWAEPMYSHGKPLPPSDLLTLPDQTFDFQTPPPLGTWQKILLDLAPAGE